MRVGREAVHVGADLREQLFGGALIDAGSGRDGRDFVANREFPSASNDQVLDSGWVACTRPAGYKNLQSTASTFIKQGFGQSDTYQSGSAADKCHDDETVPQREFSPTSLRCSGSYINYEFPRQNLAGFGNYAIGSGTSTGIHGGGITRAVLRIPDGGLAVTFRDQIGYVDRNVPCTKEAKAKWKLATAYGMYLWLAYRDDLLPENERDNYVRGKTANPPSPKCAS